MAEQHVQISKPYKVPQLDALAADLSHRAATIGQDDPRDAVQAEALIAIAEGFQAGENRGYVEIPSRVGKSRLIAYLADAAYSNKLRTLVLAPTREGLLQIRSEIAELLPHDVIGVVDKYSKQFARPITLCTYKSFVDNERSGKISLETYPVVIPDESHEALTDLRATPLQKFGGILVPVSATPSYSATRTVHRLTTNEFYSLSLIDAARRGTLADFQTILVDTQISFGDLPFDQFGYKVGALSIKLRNAVAIKLALEAYNEICPGEDAIGFCADNNHAAECAKYFSDNGVTADFIVGGNQDRREKIEALAQGRIKALFSSILLTRSVDVPQVSAVLNLVPTQSIVRAKQRGARCLTINPLDPQKIGKVIEFIYTDSRWAVRQVLFPQVAGVISSMQGEVVEFASTQRVTRKPARTRVVHKQTRPSTAIVYDADAIRQIALARELKYREHTDRIALPDLVRFIRELHATHNDWITTSADYALLLKMKPELVEQAALVAGLNYTPLPQQFDKIAKRVSLAEMLRLHYELPLDLVGAGDCLQSKLNPLAKRSAGRPPTKETEFFRLLQKLAKQDETVLLAHKAFMIAVAPHIESFFEDNPELSPVDKESTYENLSEVFYSFFLDRSLLFVNRIALFEALAKALPDSERALGYSELTPEDQSSRAAILELQEVDNFDELSSVIEWLDTMAKKTRLSSDLPLILRLYASGEKPTNIANNIGKDLRAVRATIAFAAGALKPYFFSDLLQFPNFDAIFLACRDLAQSAASREEATDHELDQLADNLGIGGLVLRRVYTMGVAEQRKIVLLRRSATYSDAKKFFGMFHDDFDKFGSRFYETILNVLPADTIVKILDYQQVKKLPRKEDLDFLLESLSRVSEQHETFLKHLVDLAAIPDMITPSASISEIMRALDTLYPNDSRTCAGIVAYDRLSRFGALIFRGIFVDFINNRLVS